MNETERENNDDKVNEKKIWTVSGRLENEN